MGSTQSEQGASLVAQLVKNLPAIQETRERLPTPVFWPGELHGLFCPKGPKELDMTERLSFSLSEPAGTLHGAESLYGEGRILSLILAWPLACHTNL